MSEELTLLQIRQKIFWADYYTEGHKFTKFNFRKHGVTIDNNFLSALANNQFLNTSHFTFFQQLFKHYYGKQQVLSLDCYFFNEVMPDISKQITQSMLAAPLIQSKETTLSSEQYTSNSQITQKSQQPSNKSESKLQFVINKTKFLLSYLNPFAYFPKKEEQVQQDIPQMQITQNQTNNVDQLQKYNFQIQNITYVKKDPKEKDKIISKSEMKITNFVVLENEKGSFKHNRLSVLMNNLCQEYEFNESYNVFSLFRFTYVPINIQNNHWICAIIVFQDQRIQYLDSYFKSQQSNVVEGLKSMVNYKGETINWNITLDSPKQDNSYDCGVFCLMALYNLYKTKKPITSTSFTQDTINSFRKQLLQLAIIASQTEINQKLLNIILDYQYKKQ